MTDLCWAWLRTPVGPVSVGCSSNGVAKVRYGSPPGRPDPARHGEQLAGDQEETAGDARQQLARDGRQQLAEYFRGQRTSFDLPLDWSGTAGPQREVLGVLATSVGYGETISYGGLASRAGLAASGDVPPARAVGTIMGSNPIPVIVPCHRVLAADGLGGYSGGAGLEVKRWLLILEGSLPPTLDWQPMDSA